MIQSSSLVLILVKPTCNSSNAPVKALSWLSFIVGLKLQWNSVHSFHHAMLYIRGVNFYLINNQVLKYSCNSQTANMDQECSHLPITRCILLVSHITISCAVFVLLLVAFENARNWEKSLTNRLKPAKKQNLYRLIKWFLMQYIHLKKCCINICTNQIPFSFETGMVAEVFLQIYSCHIFFKSSYI